MNCPKCGKNKCRYIQRREDFHKTQKERFKRSNFDAECKACGFKGAVR